MSAIGKPLHLRLFLEGIEVPVIAAQVSTGINAPSAATIQMVPTDRGLELMPRTMVHLFYLDNTVIGWEDDESGERGNFVSRSLRDYKLLFSGEMIAYQYQQTPQGRGLMLQCVDFSAYWDSAHATAVEYGPGGNWATHTAAVSGGDASLFDDLVNTQKDKVVSWLKQTPRTPGLNTVSGLAGGIIRIMEAMGGVPGHEAGVNDFFTIAELRCKLLQQIVAEENDSTARELFSTAIFDEWVRNGLQNMGQQVTFRDLMKMLFQYIYYEMVPNPAAKLDPAKNVSGQKKTTITSTPTVAKRPEGIQALQRLRDKAQTIQNAIDRSPNLSTWSTVIEDVRTKIGEARDALRKIQDPDQSTNTVIVEVGYVVSEAERLLQITPTSWKTDAADLLNLLRSAAAAITGSKTESVEKVTSTATSDRLYTQVFRPDCWFAPPPVCNVVFPEQYASLQFERNYLGEVTRLLVLAYNTLVGPDRLLATRVLAPYLTQTTKKLTQYVGDYSYRVLMDHEHHSGIVPREEWLPNTAATSKEKEASAREKKAGVRLQWVQRISLFNFFKYRFAQRSAAVGGRFNPGLVCGFPAVVIRAPFYPKVDASDAGGELSAEYVLDNARSLGAPTHLVGMVSQVSHNVDQQGGITNFQLHHLRHHSGTDDEYLSVVKQSKTVTREIQVTMNFESISSSTDQGTSEKLLNYLCDLTPQSSAKAAPARTSRSSTSSSSGQTATSEKAMQPRTPPEGTVFAGKGESRYLAPVGGKIGPGAAGPLNHGKVTKVAVTDSSFVQVGKRRAFREAVVTVSEDITTDVEIPTEEIIRPRSWFSKKYANDLIGRDIYQPFFGCNSIIDELRMLLGDQVIEDPDFAGPAQSGSTSANALVAYVDEVKFSTSKQYKHSIERAVDLIAYTYGRVKKGSKDVEDFIQQFTYRPIANREDIFGSPNLQFDVDAKGKATPKPAGAKVGFHTVAVHEQLVNHPVKLAGLVEDITLQLPRISGTGAAKVLTNYDVRKEKRDRVLRYHDELMGARAFRG